MDHSVDVLTRTIIIYHPIQQNSDSPVMRPTSPLWLESIRFKKNIIVCSIIETVIKVFRIEFSAIVF